MIEMMTVSNDDAMGSATKYVVTQDWNDDCSDHGKNAMMQ